MLLGWIALSEPIAARYQSGAPLAEGFHQGCLQYGAALTPSSFCPVRPSKPHSPVQVLSILQGNSARLTSAICNFDIIFISYSFKRSYFSRTSTQLTIQGCWQNDYQCFINKLDLCDSFLFCLFAALSQSNSHIDWQFTRIGNE